jgi:hypothetical protein
VSLKPDPNFTASRHNEAVTADLVARTIQLILAPVVMISSAAVILNGLLAHYGEVNARIRAMDRERFDLVYYSIVVLVTSMFVVAAAFC